MNESIIKAHGAHPFGLRWLAERNGAHADMLMDFGVYRMKKGDVWEEAAPLEKAALLVYGEVKFEWDGKEHTEYRKNCFDVPPTAIHADKAHPVRITCLSDEAEINILRTDNEKLFGAKLYLPQDTPDEFRGAGLMRETSTRIVRTIFDYTNAPEANLVLGEVIGFPGKWSSYPPHHHPQPEVYFYRFDYPDGFGAGFANGDIYKTQHNGMSIITSGFHSQVTAPGYAMCYSWGIRHLEGDPWDKTRIDEPEHAWLWKEDANDHIFQG